MPESTTNGAGAGLQLRDWLAEPETSAEQLPASEPNRPQPQPRQSAPATVGVERQRRQAVSDAALVVPDLVRLQLDTALFGDRSPHGSAGPDGAPRSKNLTVLVGTVQVRTNRRGQTRREITDPGAVRYRYELSINEVFASATGVAYENYRFPITMPDAVLAAAGKQARPLPNAPARPLSDQALEQRILQAQRRLLTGTHIRVEVGYVELLRGTPISADARA